MEFRTKLVVSRKNKRAVVAYIGLGVAASSLILVFIPNMEDYLGYVFGSGIAILVIGAIIARGDVRTYGLSEEELAVDPRGIMVGRQYYPIGTITELDFNVEAYAGLYVNDGAMVSGSKSDGMTNGLSFRSGGKSVECGFLLESPAHVQVLGAIFNEWYLRHLPFIERNRSTRTYMFQHLSPKELEAFKKQYGYA